MKITKEVKAKIFSLYYGQSVLRWHQWIDSTPNSFVDMRTPMRLELSVGNGWYILLKPLSEISDEDAIQVSEILYGSVTRATSIRNTKIIIDCICDGFIDDEYKMSDFIHIIQLLQSKGYALPYFDYSVNDLVELGVYKLT